MADAEPACWTRAEEPKLVIEAGDSSRRQEASVSDAADWPSAASAVFLFVSNQHNGPSGYCLIS